MAHGIGAGSVLSHGSLSIAQQQYSSKVHYYTEVTDAIPPRENGAENFTIYLVGITAQTMPTGKRIISWSVESCPSQHGNIQFCLTTISVLIGKLRSVSPIFRSYTPPWVLPLLLPLVVGARRPNKQHRFSYYLSCRRKFGLGTTSMPSCWKNGVRNSAPFWSVLSSYQTLRRFLVSGNFCSSQ
jgi:hypothetical protein